MITLLAAGDKEERAEEDEVGAGLILEHLARLGALVPPVDRCDRKPEEIFAAGHSGRRLRELGYEEDVSFCARCDLYRVVPWFEDGRFVMYRPGCGVAAC